MRKLTGIPAAPGVAIGEALILGKEGFRIPRRFVTRDAIDAEIERLEKSLTQVEKQIDINRQTVATELGEQYAAIFAAHLAIVQDKKFRNELKTLVRNRQYSPEFAVSRVMRQYASKFQKLENARMAERANDLFDIEKRLLRNLLGQKRENLSALSAPVIVLAHNLTPSEAANFNPDLVLAFATEVGGRGSHTSIVAEAQGIAAVVGLGGFLTEISGGETIIVDGDNGHLILRPDEETLARYGHEKEHRQATAVKLSELRNLPAETTDGVPVRLSANIEFPHEATTCFQNGADGIGLYRTEFLYLLSEAEPDEEMQFAAYSTVVKTMENRPVVFRTLDLGADKMLGISPSQEEKNPFLGLRSIRLSLRNQSQFRTQIRAILRASALGNVQIMFPLISTLAELRQAKNIVQDVKRELAEAGIGYNSDLQIGMMVEVPATVMLLDRFVKEVDFISIGTNDLIQYALAVDRTNPEVANLYSAADPAVLRLIQMCVESANKAGVSVSLCGQMSGNPVYTMLLLGLGLRHLSLPPQALLEIKRVCRSVSISQCEALAKKASELESAAEVKDLLTEQLYRTVPELA